MLWWYAVVCVLVYPFGINVMYGWLLLRQTEKIKAGGAKHVGFLYDAFKPEYFYWEIVDNSRRLSLTGLLALFPERNRVLVASLFALFFQILHAQVRPFAIE